MRRAICIVAGVICLTAGLTTGNVKAFKAASPQSKRPEISGARSNGKKLWVTGDNFSAGAVILINGREVGTVNDPDNPTGMLIAKKGGKRMPAEKIAAITIENDDGALSHPFDLFAGLTVTLDDAGKTISLAVGQRFQLLLKAPYLDWTVQPPQPPLISKVTNETGITGGQGIFQAVLPGKTLFSAVGDLPCAKLVPPCLAPSRGFLVNFVIE